MPREETGSGPEGQWNRIILLICAHSLPSLSLFTFLVHCTVSSIVVVTAIMLHMLVDCRFARPIFFSNKLFFRLTKLCQVNVTTFPHAYHVLFP